MYRIASILLSALLLFLLGFVFVHPLPTVWLVFVAVPLAVVALLLSRDDAKKLLVTLNILFMLLILVLFTLNNKWDQASIALFLNCLSISLLFASAELIIFLKIKRRPFVDLLFLIGFWTPIAIPVFFIGQRTFGLPGGILLLAALFIIVVREMFKRKKALDLYQESKGGDRDENL